MVPIVMSFNTPDTLTGSVERITYYNDETNYCVLRLRPHQLMLGRDELITVVGTMPELQPGESVRLQGEWTNHPRHGRQFRAEIVTQVRPATVEAIQRYLGSGLIKGVGPVTAKRIVDFFGTETLDMLDRTPNRVLEVPGVGQHRDQADRAGVERAAAYQRRDAISAGARHHHRPRRQDLQAVWQRGDPHRQPRPVPARRRHFRDRLPHRR